MDAASGACFEKAYCLFSLTLLQLLVSKEGEQVFEPNKRNAASWRRKKDIEHFQGRFGCKVSFFAMEARRGHQLSRARHACRAFVPKGCRDLKPKLAGFKASKWTHILGCSPKSSRFKSTLAHLLWLYSLRMLWSNGKCSGRCASQDRCLGTEQNSRCCFQLVFQASTFHHQTCWLKLVMRTTARVQFLGLHTHPASAYVCTNTCSRTVVRHLHQDGTWDNQ